MPATCEVQCYVRMNGNPIEKATVRAKLVSSQSSTAGAIVSTAWDTTKTDVSGYATLNLIRNTEFVTGNGQYKIQAFYKGTMLWEVTTTIPDSDTVNLEDLV